MQRGDEVASEPGRERADIHGFGGDLEANPTGKKTFLNLGSTDFSLWGLGLASTRLHRLKSVLLARADSDRKRLHGRRSESVLQFYR